MTVRLLKKSIIIILIVLAIICMYLLVNTEGEKPEAIKKVPGFDILLPDLEFSSIVQFQDMIYAGGVQGLFRINPDTLDITEIKEDNRPLEMINALYVKQDNELWTGHKDGILILKNGKYRTIKRKDGLKDPAILDILELDENTVYASTFSGVAVINENSIKYVTRKDFLPGDVIKVMYKDSRGWVWFGSYSSEGGGVVCKKGAGMQAFDIKNGLVHNCITSITESPDKKIYIGGGLYTEGGANILEYKDYRWRIVKTIKITDGLAGEKVRHIFIDRDINIWFCSEYDGISIFKKDGKKVILTEKNGLSNNEVKKIIQDNNGNFWLAAKKGITLIHQPVSKYLYN